MEGYNDIFTKKFQVVTYPRPGFYFFKLIIFNV